MTDIGGGLSIPTSNVGFVVTDMLDQFANTPPATAAGVALVTLGPPDPNYWFFDRMTIAGNSTLRPVCTLYRNAALAQNKLDSSLLGNDDVADNASPLVLKPTQLLLLVWTGATPGAVFTVTAQGRIVARRQQ